MAIDLEDEILQDFLVEAGELLERLGEQLVELEQRPQDRELLNAVFRNFHTVKGGAGFLSLDSLVEICHRAEDVFNILRQGERNVDAKLMDVVLRALDVVNLMVDGVRNGVEPKPADRDLIAQLDALTAAGAVSSDQGASSKPVPPVVPEKPVSDADFEVMLDQAAKLPSNTKSNSNETVTPTVSTPLTTPKPKSPVVGDITEDEFERLLDQLQPSTNSMPESTKPSTSTSPPMAVKSSPPSTQEDITENEFDNLLDNLHSIPTVQSTAKPNVFPANAEASSVQKGDVASTKTNKVDTTTKSVAKEADAEHGDSSARAGKDAAVAETTVRVDTKRLDDIMNLVGELVLVRNRLATLRASMADEVAKAVGNLDLVTADLQNAVMKTRMQPIKKVFGRFPRVVRDLARSLNKQVNLELFGEETDLDKNLVEALADPLVHLVRNAVDHGIESPELRQQRGKSAMGTVKLAAEQEGDHILLSIEDDGSGMDPMRLRRKAVEKGVLDEDAAARLDDNQCYNLIFLPGFSTKDEISDISGRGVGMDVVKTRITQLNGTIDISSHTGKGTRISIKVPLTLAIMPTLMVQLADQIFALPLANVIEIFDSDSAKMSTVDGKRVVIVREKALPLVYLRDWLVRSGNRAEKGKGYVVVVSYGSQHVGCVVDQLIGQEEVVIKPLGSMLQGTQGLAGATITGNGRIALILDMPGLMESYGRRA